MKKFFSISAKAGIVVAKIVFAPLIAISDMGPSEEELRASGKALTCLPNNGY